MTLKKIFQQAIDRNGWSRKALRQALAKEGVHVSGPAISLWTNNRGGVSDRHKHGVAKVLGVSVEDLVSANLLVESARQAPASEAA